MLGDVQQTFQEADMCRRHENRVNAGEYQCLFPRTKEFIFSGVFKINAVKNIRFKILFNTYCNMFLTLSLKNYIISTTLFLDTLKCLSLF